MQKNLYFILSLLLLWGCSQSNLPLQNWSPAETRTKVLVTIAMIEDLVRAIGGDTVAPLTLVKGELDPHSYQLVKGDDEKIARADLVICSGLGLEHGPSLRESLINNPKAICLGDLIKKSNPSEILYIQNTPDPHIWMDVSLWAKGVPYIVEALSKLHPDKTDEYKERGEALIKNMLEEHHRLRARMQEVPDDRRYLVTSHDAFNYFTRAYLATDKERAENSWSDRFAAPEGLAPESQLSSSDIRLILDHIKTHNVHVIFSESNVSKASIRKLLDAGNEEGLHLTIAGDALYGDAMGPPGSSGDTYLKMIEHNIDTISSYFNHVGSSDEK